MDLSDRKKKILQIVVDDYINTAVPVSSKNISENHLKNLSSATVRSELSALEDMGYLLQLHTSSGRVPSPLAYKLYVKELMSKKELSARELDCIKNIFKERANDLEDVVKNAVKVISELTEYTSLAFASDQHDEIIQNVKLLKIKENHALLLVVTENRLYKDSILELPQLMTDENLKVAERMLNELLNGRNLQNLSNINKDMNEKFNEFNIILDKVLEVLKNYVNNKESAIVSAGENMIFNYPEYSDLDKVKNFLSVVTSKDRIKTMLNNNNDNIELTVTIGRDETNGMPEDCSLVKATYVSGGVNLGTYGVIGPIRMDYNKVITVLENVGKMLESIIKN